MRHLRHAGRHRRPASRARRRAGGVGAGLSTAVAALGGASLVGTGVAAAAPTPGQGSAYAQSLQLTPHEGSLAVGAVFGEALAGHTGDYARAQSEGLDLGAIGTSMKGYNCGQAPNPYVAGAVPSPLEAETGQPGAAEGETVTDPSKTYGATEFAQATATPLANARTTYGSLDATVFTVSGAQSHAWSGLQNDNRVAGATSDIATLSIAGGAVVLNGLHWAATYPSTGGAHPTGSFSLGQAIVGGTPLPSGASLDTVASAANAVLGNLGIKLVLPKVSAARGIETVTPLSVEVVPNSTRDAVVDQGLNAIAPVYQQATHGLESGFGSWEPAQLQQALCQSDTAITVTDITIASISGAGFFNATLGGVHATSSQIAANPYNLSLPSFALGAPSQFVPGTPGTPGTPGSLGTAGASLPGPAVAASSGAAASSPTVAAPAANATSTAGGPLLALGLAGLAGAFLLAEGDRRIILRSRRQTAFED